METAVLEQKQRLSVEEFLMLQSQTEKALEYNNGEVFEINHMKSTELLTVKKLTRKLTDKKVYSDQGFSRWRGVVPRSRLLAYGKANVSTRFGFFH